MSESEETTWRLTREGEETEDKTSAVNPLPSDDEQKKAEFQQTIPAKAEDIGGGGEGSLVNEPEEVSVTEAPRKQERKPKGIPRKKKESDTDNNVAKLSKQLERQANQLMRIEKVILPLQKSVTKIDKQTNTIKQLYGTVTQLQRQIRLNQNRKQNHGLQKKKRDKISTNSSKKRQAKGRR